MLSCSFVFCWLLVLEYIYKAIWNLYWYKRVEGYDGVRYRSKAFFPFGAFRYPFRHAVKLTLAGGNPSDNRYCTI